MTLTQGFTNAEAERVYVKHMQDTHGELDIPRLCETLYNAGARHAIEASVAVNDIVPLLATLERRTARLRAIFEQFSGPGS